MKRKKLLKTRQQITGVGYIHVIVFRMHGRDTTMEREFDIVLQMTLEHALTERFEQSNK